MWRHAEANHTTAPLDGDVADRRRTSRPVSRVLSRTRGCTDGHPSRAAVADSLVRSTRELGRAALERSLSDLAPGGVCLAARVTPDAGGLLHRRFTLTAVPPEDGPAAVFSLWHCPAGHPGWVLPTTLPCGARTFLGETREGPDATVRPARPPCDQRSGPQARANRTVRRARSASTRRTRTASPSGSRPSHEARTAGSTSCTVPPPRFSSSSTATASNS